MAEGGVGGVDRYKTGSRMLRCNVRPLEVLTITVIMYTVPAWPAESHNTMMLPSAVAEVITRSPGLFGAIETSRISILSPGFPIKAHEISNP